MPTTLRNTDILFNDSTTQTTAFTSTAVLNAVAGASAGAVGTYVYGEGPTSNVTFGSTTAGSNISPTSSPYYSQGSFTYVFTTGSTLSGTWRAMGTFTYQISGCCSQFIRGATLWLRIS